MGEFPINALGVKACRQNNNPPIIKRVGDKMRLSRLYISKDMGKTWTLFGASYNKSHLCYVLPSTFGPQLITPEIMAKFAEKMREKAAKKAAKLTAEASRF